MKKSDKIAGIISVLAIVALIIYWWKSEFLRDLPIDVVITLFLLFLLAILTVVGNFFVIGIIMRKRIKKFAEIAKKYSLEHSYHKFFIFFPIGELNTIKGTISGKNVEITDECFKPGLNEYIKLASRVVFGYLYSNGGSFNLRTRIIIDGHTMIPDENINSFSNRSIFQKISKIKDVIENL